MATHRAWRFEAWPSADRLAWSGIAHPGGPFDDPGPAARWGDRTRDMHREQYGYWLNFLEAGGKLTGEDQPGPRVTPETVSAYLASLAGLADHTVLIRLGGLLAVSQAMAPGQGWAWLRTVVNRLQRRGPRSRPKRSRLRDSADLLEAGLALMSEAEQRATPLLRATDHRNGLMLALLASRPLRRRNLAMIELGRHLVRDGTGWLLLFAADETKTRQPIELPWPERLNDPLECYLERHRPALLAGRTDSRLWISCWARPIAGREVYNRIAMITRKLFGQALGPHLFRDCFATSMAIHDPEHIGVAATLLGHSEHVNRRHYNHARMLQAGRVYHQGLLDLRRQLAPAPPGKRRAGSR